MVLLDPLNEDKVVENLKLRYSKKDIYVRKYIQQHAQVRCPDFNSMIEIALIS